jgi:hypothetical protein
VSGELSPSDSVSLAVHVCFSLTGCGGGVGNLSSRLEMARERTRQGIEEVRKVFFFWR